MRSKPDKLRTEIKKLRDSNEALRGERIDYRRTITRTKKLLQEERQRNKNFKLLVLGLLILANTLAWVVGPQIISL